MNRCWLTCWTRSTEPVCGMFPRILKWNLGSWLAWIKKYPILFFLHLSSLSFLPRVFFSSSPLSLDTLVLNLIHLCQWPGVSTFQRGLNAAVLPQEGSSVWGTIVCFLPYNASMERPFKDNTAWLQHRGSAELDGGGLNANTRLAAAFGVSVGAFCFFRPCRSPPPAPIKRALCERGCEEGRRSSQGPRLEARGWRRLSECVLQEFF